MAACQKGGRVFYISRAKIMLKPVSFSYIYICAAYPRRIPPQ